MEPLQQGLVGDGIIEIVGGIVAVCSAVITWYIRKMYNDWADRGQKLDELYQAIFGIDNIDTMEGVVEIVESHDTELSEHRDRMDSMDKAIQEGRRKRQEIRTRVDSLKERSNQRCGEEG